MRVGRRLTLHYYRQGDAGGGLCATPAEALNAITGLAAYCAVDIHMADGFIVHHVEIDRSPNRVGEELKRWFMFHGPDRFVFRVDAWNSRFLSSKTWWCGAGRG